MKNIIPACTNCRTRTFMVQDRSAEKAGGILGAIMGASTVYSSSKTASAVSMLLSGVVSVASRSAWPAWLVLPGPITVGSLIMAALTSSATGSLIGQHLDTKLRMRYRCNRCGCVVKG